VDGDGEDREHGLCESKSNSLGSISATVVSAPPTTDDVFGDSDEDELFSRIDEEMAGDSTAITSTGQSQEFEKIALATPPMNDNSGTIMGPPAAPGSSHSRPPSTRNSARDNPSIQISQTSLNVVDPHRTDSRSVMRRSSTDRSREAFFANWDNESISSYEKRLQTQTRRFPGPAGLLPVIPLEAVKHLSDADHPLSQHFSKIIKSDCSFKKGKRNQHQNSFRLNESSTGLIKDHGGN
jgi:hypothetical protein